MKVEYVIICKGFEDVVKSLEVINGKIVVELVEV